MRSTFVSESSFKGVTSTVGGSIEELQGERYYRVANSDAMPPFFMSLVSDSDHWFFISSNGALTAGRRDPDHALFPYYTDDRIHDSLDQTGSKTVLRIKGEEKTSLWEPFSHRYEGLYHISRNLYKSLRGNRILFEEVNHDLALTFRYEWMNSEAFGFVRRATLHNHGETALSIDLVDGIQNVLPSGLGRRFQLEYSTLGDGYKRTELVPEVGLALFRLSSIPADRAEPSEALAVNVAWSVGLGPVKHLLSSAQLDAFRQGRALTEERDVRGQRGAYLLNASIQVAHEEQRTWYLVAEVDQDAAHVRKLRHRLLSGEDLIPELLADVDRGTRNLVGIVAAADGLQKTEDELSTCRHFSNTLFNVMRGGIPDDAYRISSADFRAFVGTCNRDVATRRYPFLQSLPAQLSHRSLLAVVEAQGDPELERLAHEYLPLTFSRRHGDPSRPWNIFSIQIKDERGRKLLGYEGNWRDIFQNWEALAFAYPDFTEGMIFKFLDSSTADGYNPYRILREGFDWEVIDPHDAWSFIGYWGDHQIIYLLKLLETSCRYHPERLHQLLNRRVFSYANVPYRIKPYEELLADPRRTITFDAAAQQETLARVARLGADGKLLYGPGGIIRASLAEKLLVVILTKLSNYVPGAGLWMNTQRPEWNDANNALVGYGVSMVTLYYLRRFLTFCRDLFLKAEGQEFLVAGEVAEWFEGILSAFEHHSHLSAAPISDWDRKSLMDALGQAGSRYRGKLYQDGLSMDQAPVSVGRAATLCEVALGHINHAIRGNRRHDGLYHAYNLMKTTDQGVEVRHLYEMLEGQVAVLSSGALTVEESLEVLDALRASRLYRQDQASYILYPDRSLPTFLETNNLPEAAVASSELLVLLLASGDECLVNRDVEGQVHFHASFHNVRDLQHALDRLEAGVHGPLVARERDLIPGIYEGVFDHQSFTGRSGTFFKYEGLGCIYWHMVSKLLMAVDEVQKRALACGTPAEIRERVRAHYDDIRAGIGVHKSPEVYGAIPTDPYSHTPSFAGAQQPGMTGQVKEDFLTRFSEMGVDIEQGQIAFRPELVAMGEFLRSPGLFEFLDAGGEAQGLLVGEGSLAFTLCQVPVIVHREGAPRMMVLQTDGTLQTLPGLNLDAATSARIFDRTEEIARVDVFLGLTEDFGL